MTTSFLGIILKKLAKKLAHLEFRSGERFCSQAGRSVDAPGDAARPFLGRSQIAAFLKPVQDRIQSASTQFVAVSSQFLDHCQPINRPLHRMMAYLQAYQASVEEPIIDHIGNRYWHPL